MGRMVGTGRRADRSGRRRRRWAVLVVLAAAATTAGCQDGVWMGDPSAREVSVIGDSLIFQAEGNEGLGDSERLLADELVARGDRAHVAGWIGFTLQQGHDALWPKVASDPDLEVLVIALGTNDIANDVPLETSRAQLRQWLVEAAAVDCVALIGLNVQAFAWRLDIFGPAFNQMLLEEAARHPNATYVEWHPDLAIHGTDGDVHFHSPEARAQYRETIHLAVDGCAAT